VVLDSIIIIIEWGWTARIVIARHAIGQHFLANSTSCPKKRQLINQLLGILTSWKMKKNSISWIQHHEKMNFDLMKFDLLTLSPTHPYEIKSRQISTVCLDLDPALVNVITFLARDFSICLDFRAWSLEKVLKKSQLCQETSKILDESWKSQ
jgi:hypothetical protein